MSTMNSEIYAALIDAGSSEEKAKAKAAAVSVTDYERDMNEVKSELKLIKWGGWFNYCCRSNAIDESIFFLIKEGRKSRGQSA